MQCRPIAATIELTDLETYDGNNFNMDWQQAGVIVDFPSSITEEQRVCFADHCEGNYINYPSKEENKKKWYSGIDEKRSRVNVSRDAAMCSKLIEAAFDEPQRHRRMRECLLLSVGLENLISRDFMARYQARKDARKNHIVAVLEEQNRQRLDGQMSSSRLAHVSMQSSGWSRQLAHRVAMLNASIL